MELMGWKSSKDNRIAFHFIAASEGCWKRVGSRGMEQAYLLVGLVHAYQGAAWPAKNLFAWGLKQLLRESPVKGKTGLAMKKGSIVGGVFRELITYLASSFDPTPEGVICKASVAQECETERLCKDFVQRSILWMLL